MKMTGWVYRDMVSEDGEHVYVVGFYSPDGVWHPETDWDTADEAAMRVHYLNGGPEPREQELEEILGEDEPEIPF